MNGILVILNPAARGDKAGDLVQQIEALSSDVLVVTTSAPGEARMMADRAARQGHEIIVAAGGDGTINEVVNGIAGHDVTLGVLPVGTMNVFAAELGMPGANQLAKCWSVIEAGRTRLIDLPRANDQYFVQLGGIGLDAQVVKETSLEFKKNFGPLSYVISATQIASRPPPKLQVQAEGRTREGSFVLIGNGRYYGGPFVIFQSARLDDGLLDVLIFKNLGYLDIIRYLHGIIFQTHTSLPDVEYFQAAEVTVSSPSDVLIEVDGELIGSLPVTFRISEKKLRVIVPG